MASDFHSIMAKHQDAVTEEQQKKAGQPVAGAMSKEHKVFVETIMDMVDSGKIDPMQPQTFLNQSIYEKLDEEWKDKTDIALANIATQLQHIVEFWRSNETPEESPQLDTMVEHLWQTKQRIEKHYDVFKF